MLLFLCRLFLIRHSAMSLIQTYEAPHTLASATMPLQLLAQDDQSAMMGDLNIKDINNVSIELMKKG